MLDGAQLFNLCVSGYFSRFLISEFLNVFPFWAMPGDGVVEDVGAVDGSSLDTNRADAFAEHLKPL